MPLVIAFVVVPTASSSVRICAPSGLTSPDISAMPCALSETGPKVSIATITPTVVSRPQPARATAQSDRAEQAAAAKCRREQRDGERRATEEGRPEHRGADEQRRVDGGLE